MDSFSITASIIAVLQLTSKVIEYLNNVKDAPKDCAQCAIEASNLYNLLITLRSRLEEGSSNEPWNAEVQKLCEKDGLLDQYKLALERLQAIITSQGGMKKTGHFILICDVIRHTEFAGNPPSTGYLKKAISTQLGSALNIASSTVVAVMHGCSPIAIVT